MSSLHRLVRILAIAVMMSTGRICRPLSNGRKQKGEFFENVCCGQAFTKSLSCRLPKKLVNHAHNL